MRKFINYSIYFLLIFSAASSAISAQTFDNPEAEITITDYELEDYYRHPRMEEEDRLNGRTFHFKPGLEIITSSDDFLIYFFEEKIGWTPWERDNMKPGAYRVKLEKTGFATINFWVNVKSDRRTVVLVNVKKPEGKLILKNIPSDAVITVDKQIIDGHELSLSEGPHILEVDAFGYKTVSENIEITSGETSEWVFSGIPAQFNVKSLKVTPEIISSQEETDINISWISETGGTAELKIYYIPGNSGTPASATNNQKEILDIPLNINSYENSYTIKTRELRGLSVLKDGTQNSTKGLPEGKYKAVIINKSAGTGTDTAVTENEHKILGETYFTVDNRFQRSPRTVFSFLPGLVYSPGTAMLPPGSWQISSGAGFNYFFNDDSDSSGIPVTLALRISPAARFEIGGKFNFTARNPFDNNSIAFSLYTSWRATPHSTDFSANVEIMFYYSGYTFNFGTYPVISPDIELPGLTLTLPMEYRINNFSLILSPSMFLFFPGKNTDHWTFSSPVNFTGAVSGGFYYEKEKILTGVSLTVRMPDVTGGYTDWQIWSGAEGRIILPGEASYISLFGGARFLSENTVLSLGIDFGIFH